MSLRANRPSAAFIASIVVHVVVLMLFVQALLMRKPLIDLFGHRQAPPIGPVERIGFLNLPRQAANQPATVGKRGGNNRPLRAEPPAKPIVAPQAITPTIAPSTQTTPSSVEPSTGPMVGGGGETRGVQPHYNDPRLWGEPGSVVSAPKTPAERLDSLIGTVIAPYNDSMRVANAGKRAPGDWTVDHNGKKYGIDQKFIRLGPVSIPTAILALLPLNKIGGNPTVMDRDRRNNAMHDEIFSQAQRAVNDADFEKAVRSIRERKERQRAEQKAAADSATAAKSQ